MSFYSSVVRPMLFRMDPEKVHHLVNRVLASSYRTPGVSQCLKSAYKTDLNGLELFGVHFPNRVGLAAGFDKDAKHIGPLSALGFGFIEIGTVTPKPQEGNPKKRLFRLKQDQALINRMGFNNDGVEAAVERLKEKPEGVVVGCNIGKNKVTPNEEAVNDYVICFKALHPYADYFVVNVSSPNTPGLRELQDKEPLLRILNALKEENAKIPKPRPILLKIAPDLTNEQIKEVVEVVTESDIDGVVATNTTIDRSKLNTDEQTVKDIGAGGVSGTPVRERSTEVVRMLASLMDKPIIGVGGIDSIEAAQEKIDAGASLVQVYTGFIYQGPGLVKRIAKALG